MDARSIEYEMAMSGYRKHQDEMNFLLKKIVGRHGAPQRSLKDFREELSSKLEGVSPSRMIIEAR